MIYYNNRYLSDRLGINLSKWKRWSREFLAPDPLGGLQSGVARQFNIRDAFKVYLGGYMVSQLKLSLPDASKILADLSPWLKNNGFFSLEASNRHAHQKEMPIHHVYIHAMSKQGFSYVVRTIVPSFHPNQPGLKSETFTQTLIRTESDPILAGSAKSAQVVSITVLYNDFLSRISEGANHDLPQ